MISLSEKSGGKRALIILNGEKPSVKFARKYAEEADVIITCDGAAEFALEAGIKPQLMIGDFDSLGLDRSVELSEDFSAKRIALEKEKNMSDGQAALEFALLDGCTRIDLIGALGGRFDHALFNAELLVKAFLGGAIAVIRDDESDVYATCTHVFVDGKIGDTVSIIPLGVSCAIKLLDGLKYPLYDHFLTLGDTRTLSNEMLGERALVEMLDGWVLVIRNDA